MYKAITFTVATVALLSSATLHATSTMSQGFKLQQDQTPVQTISSGFSPNGTVTKDFGTASADDYARRADSMSSKGYSPPFMLIDMAINDSRTVVVNVKAKSGPAEQGYQGSKNYPTGAVSWSGNYSLEPITWLLTDPHTGNSQEIKATLSGSTGICLAGNSVMTLIQEGTSNTLQVSCYTMPKCADQPLTSAQYPTIYPGVITKSGKKYCAG